MPLLCYAYANNNSNSNTVCNTDVVAVMLLCYISSCEAAAETQEAKHKEVRILAVYCFIPLALRNDTSLFLFSMFSAKNFWRVYVFTWREDVKNYAKFDLTVQTKSDFQKCDLNRKFKPQTNVARNGFALCLSKNIWIFVEFKIKIHIGTQNATFEF